MRGPFRPLGDEVTVWMDAPPAKVWDLVSDVTRIGEFSPETFEAKWTRGSTGPEVGAYVRRAREAQRRRPDVLVAVPGHGRASPRRSSSSPSARTR